MRKLLLIAFITSVFAACSPFEVPEQGEIVNVEDKTLEQLTIPDAFTFNTHKDVNVAVSVKDNNGQLMPNVPFKIYIKKKNSTDSLFLLGAETSADGAYETTLSLEDEVEKMVATIEYIGVPSYQSTTVTSNNVVLTFGVENNVNLPRNLIPTRPDGTALITRSGAGFTYMGTYDADGVPTYLIPRGDVVSNSVLKMVNASLPESHPLTLSHPEYFVSTARHTVSIKSRAELFVTFVHEGTGNMNALGYYTYPTNNPPTTEAAIQNMKVIFPNSSFKNSGGGLRTGDKVSLGYIDAGLTVSWFVMPKAWDWRTQKVVEGRNAIHYSNKNFNTFTSSDYRDHVVTLLDRENQLLLVGFEDLNRPNSDHDFNDAVFYCTASPFSAIETTDMVETIKEPIDTDGDGVPDYRDAEPKNVNVSYYSYTPGLNQVNTLAFEDMWPLKGDYDMNDVVVDYNSLEKYNSKNKITELKFKLTVRALGGSFRNGFGFDLGVPQHKIASVVGTKIKDNYIQLNANGTEANQTKAVIIAFDNSASLLPAPSGSFVNTEKDKAALTDYTFEFTVTFNNPITRAELGTAPYNPFIIVNRDRGREVHLAGYKATQLANTALFKTGEDNTHGNKSYQTKTNLPWAIHVSGKFLYPIEKAPINAAYLKFNNWAESGGTTFKDWYMNKATYTNPTKIY
jgi:LruC domain-containing protein